MNGQLHAPASSPSGTHFAHEAGRAQTRFYPSEEENVLFPLPGIQPQFLCRPARSLVTILTELAMKCYCSSHPEEHPEIIRS
jgi:hypothetical protein